jgi:glycosyltransferase involved in cell wall biosynthesis
MNSPTVSVIIPAYNQANYLGEAIQSVLDQTYPDFELIVVNDASPDHTSEVVAQFNDPRLKYIIHEKNKKLSAARNTGIRASKGELIALLDADDRYSPEKLSKTVAFMLQRPEVGVAYNGRFEIDSDGNILSIHQPSLHVSHRDFVMGFPFSPSDIVIRREWIFRVGLFDESFVHFSEDLDVNCRLALAGCQFAGIDDILNYRRYYPNRTIRNVSDRLQAATRALDTTFTDVRTTPEVLALRDLATANAHLVWSYEAFISGDVELGQKTLREAVRLDPSLVANSGEKLLRFLNHRSTKDGGDHEASLRLAFSHFPPELRWLTTKQIDIIVEGYLSRGAYSLIWGRSKDALELLHRANALGASLDEPFKRRLVDQIHKYEKIFGYAQTERALKRLSTCLSLVGAHRDISWIQGCYYINKAIANYQAEDYRLTLNYTFKAISKDITRVANRGTLKMIVKSLQKVNKQAMSV